ncbi:ABC transporter permease [Pontibacter sp. H259]|uniref:ABC transporter permease/M1 family aminopeptidase n=1 Tax=Pontibacter sp. H259 TaxID=3133421 RepID=UPI0030C50739
MKLWTIFRFEFSYQIQRIATWLYLAVLLAFTLLMNLFTTPGDGVYPNNNLHIIGITVIGGLIWLVMAASVAGEAAARDVYTGMHSLTYTTPLPKFSYLAGRFLAAFAINALLILSLPVGILLSFYLPLMDQESLQPFSALPYLNVYFLIVLPSAFVATAVQFSFAALSRQVMASYLASILLALVAQIMAVTVAKLFGNWDLVKLLDPVGVAGIVSSELGTWTPTEKNTRLIALEGMFLWNRVLWLTVAILVLSYTYQRFKFAATSPNSWWSRFKRRPKVQADATAETAIIRPSAIIVQQVQREFSFATYFSQTLTIAWVSFSRISRNPIGLSLVGAIALASAMFGDRIMTQFDIPLLPTTPQVLAFFTASLGNIGSPWVVIPLLIMYFMGELIWRERDARLSDLTDATPVPEWVLLTGKYLGLAFIIIIWMALLMAGGMLMQLILGYQNVDIGLYLTTLFGLQLVDYLLFALLALVVHVVVNQKYVGYLVVLLVFCFIAFPSTFQVEHSMLIFGKDPGWKYTDMRGFGDTLGPWLWFKAYWVAWALLLAVTARLLWVRGREQGLKYRLQIAKQRFTGSTTWVALVSCVLILTLGSFIFYNTNVLHEYQTGDNLNELKAAYEHRYSQYKNTLQPQLTATKLHVEIYPEKQQVEIRAAYTLVNKYKVPIDSIHFGSMSGIAPAEIIFNKPAVRVVADEKLSHYIYVLKEALQPGDSIQLNFVVRYEQQRFDHGSTDKLVVKNGTYFTNYNMLPAIGYQPYRELKDDVLRKKYKLPAQPKIASLYDAEARKRPLNTAQSTLEAIIGTAKEEVAVAPGALKKSWVKGDRKYFHYKTDAPIGGEYAILSSNYAVQESKWNDVAIRIYYHPDHARNVDRIARSIKASLAYFTEQFGPYPYKHFTAAERAGAGGGASADASMIYYGEQYAQLTPDDSPDGFDLPYYILAHEMGHQWWGLANLTPANVEGAGVLIEGLAVYSGMQVLEETYGEGHLQKYVSFLHASYEKPRSLSSPSLLHANEEFLYYRKGGLAMHALSEYIGKQKVNSALRQLLQKHNTGQIPFPTTLHLYQELEQVTPDSLNYLLNDLFRKNIYWRLKTKQFAATQTKAGKWEVTLKIQAQKVVVESTGVEKEVPMNDWLEVGIYNEGNTLHKPLYLQKHRIRAGEQTIKVTVPRKPGSGGIDPNQLMIDLRSDDNMMYLEG